MLIKFQFMGMCVRSFLASRNNKRVTADMLYVVKNDSVRQKQLLLLQYNLVTERTISF